MACYDFDYAMQMLRQSIDFAEIEHDFVPLRKWANEVEKSGRGMKLLKPAELPRRPGYIAGDPAIGRSRLAFPRGSRPTYLPLT